MAHARQNAQRVSHEAEGTSIGGVTGDGSLQDAGGELRAHGDVVLVEGLQDEARQDLAHAEARLTQPQVPPHDLRVAALLPQLRELPQQLAAQPACPQRSALQLNIASAVQAGKSEILILLQGRDQSSQKSAAGYSSRAWNMLLTS